LKRCYGTGEALPDPCRFAGLSARERQAVISAFWNRYDALWMKRQLNNRFITQPTKHNKMFETQHYLLSDSTTIIEKIQ
jgi:hypothetical protein